MIQVIPQQALVIVTNGAFPTAISSEYSEALSAFVAAMQAATQ